ncbi:MAG: hypothetical protein A3F09_01420 [Chlamydiae bacterium RIFCSPHIGHO2_12_FULL_49_11]|nr:MAG: hypothetical protein A3F09_01420 [Chlamydiae bacterium RIFCSPHIGHO2_12_FULL_49_11]
MEGVRTGGPISAIAVSAPACSSQEAERQEDAEIMAAVAVAEAMRVRLGVDSDGARTKQFLADLVSRCPEAFQICDPDTKTVEELCSVILNIVVLKEIERGLGYSKELVELIRYIERREWQGKEAKEVRLEERFREAGCSDVACLRSVKGILLFSSCLKKPFGNYVAVSQEKKFDVPAWLVRIIGRWKMEPLKETIKTILSENYTPPKSCGPATNDIERYVHYILSLLPYLDHIENCVRRIASMPTSDEILSFKDRFVSMEREISVLEDTLAVLCSRLSTLVIFQRATFFTRTPVQHEYDLVSPLLDLEHACFEQLLEDVVDLFENQFDYSDEEGSLIVKNFGKWLHGKHGKRDFPERRKYPKAMEFLEKTSRLFENVALANLEPGQRIKDIINTIRESCPGLIKEKDRLLEKLKGSIVTSFRAVLNRNLLQLITKDTAATMFLKYVRESPRSKSQLQQHAKWSEGDFSLEIPCNEFGMFYARLHLLLQKSIDMSDSTDANNTERFRTNIQKGLIAHTRGQLQKSGAPFTFKTEDDTVEIIEEQADISSKLLEKVKYFVHVTSLLRELIGMATPQLFAENDVLWTEEQIQAFLNETDCEVKKSVANQNGTGHAMKRSSPRQRAWVETVEEEAAPAAEETTSVTVSLPLQERRITYVEYLMESQGLSCRDQALHQFHMEQLALLIKVHPEFGHTLTGRFAESAYLTLEALLLRRALKVRDSVLFIHNLDYLASMAGVGRIRSLSSNGTVAFRYPALMGPLPITSVEDVLSEVARTIKETDGFDIAVTAAETILPPFRDVRMIREQAQVKELMERARSPVVRVHLSRLLDGIRLFEKESSLPLLSLHFRILMSSIQYAFEAIGKMHYSRPIKTHNLHLLLSQYLDEVREIEELFGLEKGSDYPFSLGWREEMDAFRLSLAAQEGGFFPQGMGPKDAERLYNSLCEKVARAAALLGKII